MIYDDKSIEELLQELKRLQLVYQDVETARQESENHLQFFLNSFQGIVYRTDTNLKLLSLFGAVETITAYSPDDFLNGSVRYKKLIHPQDLPQLLQDARKNSSCRNSSCVISREYRIVAGDGRIHWLHEIYQNILNEDENETAYFQGIILDITKQKRIEEELEDKRLHLDGILTSLQDVVWSIAPDTFELLYLNPAAEKIYGYPVQEFYDHPELWTSMIHPDDSDPVVDNFASLLEMGSFESEFRIVKPDGEIRLLNRRGYFGRDGFGAVARIDGIDTDITERRRTEEKLVYLSLHDSLTGLFNRTFFEHEMQRMEKESQAPVGIVVCDLDGLKLVNDNLGHDWGDNLLVIAANVIQDCFRKGDVIARIGGDEFAVLLPGVNEENVLKYCQRISDAIEKYNNDNEGISLSISAGCAARNTGSPSMNILFRDADQNMYSEKMRKSEKNRKLVAQSIVAKLQGSKIINDQRDNLLQMLIKKDD